MTTSPLLITPVELVELRASGAPVRILDVRWRLDKPDGRADYEAGHIPGAVYVDLDSELAGHGEPTDGRHPLPDRDALHTAARRWGINTGDTVVIYDNLKNFSAARAWWLLANAGFPTIRLLDGSLRAWTEAGFDIATGNEVPEPGTVALDWDRLPSLDLDGAAIFPATGALLDSRAPERYRGETEPMDPKAGHIPGALNAPSTANVDTAGRFLSPEVLREQFLALGVAEDAPVAAYCGSGVMAAHNAFALTLAGFAPVIYPGSWSQWSNHPDRPVATGANP